MISWRQSGLLEVRWILGEPIFKVWQSLRRQWSLGEGTGRAFWQLGIGRRLDFAPKLWQMFSSGAFSCGMARFCSQCPLIFGRKGEGGGCRRTNRPRLGRQRALQQGEMGGGMVGTKEKYFFYTICSGAFLMVILFSKLGNHFHIGLFLVAVGFSMYVEQKSINSPKVMRVRWVIASPAGNALGCGRRRGGGRTILDMAFLSKCGQLSSMSIFIQTKRGNEKLLKIWQDCKLLHMFGHSYSLKVSGSIHNYIIY